MRLYAEIYRRENVARHRQCSDLNRASIRIQSRKVGNDKCGIWKSEGKFQVKIHTVELSKIWNREKDVNSKEFEGTFEVISLWEDADSC